MKKIFVFLFVLLFCSAALVGCSPQQVSGWYSAGLVAFAFWAAAFLGFAICKAVSYWATLSADEVLKLALATSVFRWLSLLPWALILWLKEKIGARKNASSR